MRAERRRTLAGELKQKNEELKKENQQLRDAARQLMAGLTEYCKVENWVEDDGGRWVWTAKGDGPKVARHYLGLEEENN